MSVKEELFDLIKSLSPSEKRYFRIHAARNDHGENHYYWDLYEALLNLEKYDESLLRTQLAASPVLPQLSYYKNYLKKLLLRNLREYHLEKSHFMEMRAQLDQVELLYQKGLYPWCKRELKRLRKKAVKVEALGILLEVNRWEMKISRISQEDGFLDRLEELSLEKERLLQNLMVEDKLLSLKDRYHGLMTRFIHPRNSSDREMVLKLNQDPQLLSDDELPTLRSRLTFYFCKLYGHQILGEIGKTIFWHQRLDQLYFENPDLIKQNQERYLKVLLGYCDNLLEAARFHEFHTHLDRIQQYQADTPSLKALTFRIWIHLKIRYCLNSGKYSEGSELWKPVIEGFRIHKRFVPLAIRLAFCYNLMLIAFLGKDFKQALNWINFILNSKEKEARQDIRLATRIFNLIVHYELKNYDLIPTLQRSFSRYVNQQEMKADFEKIIFKYIRKVVDTPPNQHRQILLRLQSVLKEFDNAVLDSILGSREVLLWLESVTSKII